ncbi:hypothetical protein M409DRAFT_19565 [Zasmidium cellare ATCC 36951]|uniref:Uncharacterized protein n=1 Tax=Zasmidium cellare ATCC 36951 TaxID=1080233 RepID=A0A6A6CUT5_ZASCE|nr:uncharacterized protein M409DRAFT_19565 [Zasmidium cellare ATCC 36951]KAF2169950.1 hypothetical protein M409DRAFT_19565 [Zasmidium cellare ATCC 36951]
MKSAEDDSHSPAPRFIKYEYPLVDLCNSTRNILSADKLPNDTWGNDQAATKMDSNDANSMTLDQDGSSKDNSQKGCEKEPRHPTNFFSLSAELRNRIYEEVLIQDDAITIDAFLKPPTLPQTCRQIRNESAGIFYLRNTIFTRIIDLDASLYGAFYRLAQKYEDDDSCVEVLLSKSGKRHWGNLMEWAREIHGGRSRGEGYDVEHDSVSAVVAVVTEMVAAYAGMPWEKCEKALLAVRCMAGHVHSDWEKDEADWVRYEEEKDDVVLDGFD